MLKQRLEQNICDKVSEYIKTAGKMVQYSLTADKDYTAKLNRSDLVTNMDQQVEAYLIEKLHELEPTFQFLTEETNPDEAVIFNDMMTWVIDPIDGTMNFVHGFERISISIALCAGSKPIAAWIYDIHLDRLYHARKNEGAFLYDKRLTVSKANKLEDSVIAFGFSANQWMDRKDIPHLMKQFAGNSRGIRVTGSSCLDLADVAAGRLDGFWHFGLHPWDIAAGILLISEAGGLVTSVEKQGNVMLGKGIIASNGRFHEQLRNKLR